MFDDEFIGDDTEFSADPDTGMEPGFRLSTNLFIIDAEKRMAARHRLLRYVGELHGTHFDIIRTVSEMETALYEVHKIDTGFDGPIYYAEKR